MEIVGLYTSPGHNYFGHHGKAPDEYSVVEAECIECISDHGIRGDRFFDYRDSYKGQITFFSVEIFEALCRGLDVHDIPISSLRRNVITRGVDLNALIGGEFEVQGVSFCATEECRPCYWMDQAFAPGAEKFLRGNGGLRAKILSDGLLRVTAPR